MARVPDDGASSRWSAAGDDDDDEEARSRVPDEPLPSRRHLSSDFNGFRGPAPPSTGSFTPTGTRPSTASSRTHLPSLSSRAFFAPMNAQQLQAHRAARPGSALDQRVPEDDYDDEDTRSVTNRNSTGSVLTNYQSPKPNSEDLAKLPPPPPPQQISRESEAANSAPINVTPAEPVIPRQLPTNGVVASTSPPLPQTQQAEARTTMASTGLRKPTSTDVPHRSMTQSTQVPSLVSASPKISASGFRRPSEKASQHSFLANYTGGHEKLGSASNSPTGWEAQKDSRPDLGRNWEYYEGNSVFCLGGRLQNAKSRPIVIATALLIIIPSALFFGLSAPGLWHRVSPAVPIIFAYIFLITLSSFWHASVTDPGILPRHLAPMPVEDDDPLRIDKSKLTQWIMVQSSVAQHGAFEVPTKYCETCEIWRPPRCHHCRVCDACIDTQDHHCVWLNNCVGRRNYRYFYSFVASATFLGIYCFAASIGLVAKYASDEGVSMTEAIHQNGGAFAVFIITLLIWGYPGSLWAYHIYLTSRGQTTREYLNSNKFPAKDRHRPFTQRNAVRNWITVLVRPRPPTYLGFKQKYEEGDARLGGVRLDQMGRPVKVPNAKTDLEMNKLQPPFHGRRGPINNTPRL